ncbi:MAG: hypothetical protein CM1200mP30_13370 [Pseudomonadota bacterium]|nr:MAG: hypothetical protein CM1200mP30_13370 [Pseudomonadota bacterium]
MKFAAFNWNGFKNLGKVFENENVIQRFDLPESQIKHEGVTLLIDRDLLQLLKLSHLIKSSLGSYTKAHS